MEPTGVWRWCDEWDDGDWGAGPLAGHVVWFGHSLQPQRTPSPVCGISLSRTDRWQFGLSRLL